MVISMHVHMYMMMTSAYIHCVLLNVGYYTLSDLFFVTLVTVIKMIAKTNIDQ